MRFSKLAGTLVFSTLSVLAFHLKPSRRRSPLLPPLPLLSELALLGRLLRLPCLLLRRFYGAPYRLSHLLRAVPDRAPSALRIR
jgi:hypothetical protein